MANGTVKKPKAIKGIFERPDGSGIWWINYYIEGKRFREKVGRRSDAVALYQRRKTDARMGVKMPEVRARRAVLFEEIAADALVYSKSIRRHAPATARRSGSSCQSLARFLSITSPRRRSKRIWISAMI